MNADKCALLQEELRNLELAGQHLGFSLDRCRDLLGRDNWTPEELERLESLASRYARVSDLLTQRIMRLIDEVELTPGNTLFDRFNKAEKRGWIDNARELVRMRELRNLIAHEYAADRMGEIYHSVATLSPAILAIIPRVAAYVADLLRRYPE